MLKKLFTKRKKPIKPFSDIQQDWQNIQSLEIKSRYKAMRGIANDICNAYKGENIDAPKLQFYMDVLKQINKIHNIPRCKTALSKITALWLELTGNENAKIIKKIFGKINVETATVAIGEPSYSKEALDAYEKYAAQKILNLINQGKLFIFGTGGDGEQNIQIRVVDSLEPVLSTKEYRCILNATETLIINIPTGTLVVADPCFLNMEKERMLINVEPGNYKICVYHFYIHSKVDSFYIALCKTNEEAKNTLTKLPQFD